MKQLFVQKLYDKGLLTKKDARVLYDAVCEAIAEILQEQGCFVIRNVGKLCRKKRHARFRNPRTGETVEKNVVTIRFRTFKGFKTKLEAEEAKSNG